MKNTLKLTVTLIVLIAAITVISCKSSAKEAEYTNEMELKNDQIFIKKQHAEEVENYKKEMTTKTDAFAKNLTEFNERIVTEKKEVTANYKQKLAELDKKNSDLKKKMDDYKSEGMEQWESFKTEFNHDMNELGTALKDLVVDNEK